MIKDFGVPPDLHAGRAIHVPRGTLVVLSGLPGSGKSTIARRGGLPEGAIVSSDALRAQILGNLPTVREGRPLLHVRNDCNTTVFSVMASIVRERLTHGLTTVVDATNINDGERKQWIDLADSFGRPHLVVIVDTLEEECIARMKGRADWVPAASIRAMSQPPAKETPEFLEQKARAAKKGKALEAQAPEGFSRTSRFNHVIVDSNASLSTGPLTLSTVKTDVVGDIHGLLADALSLLRQAGWTLNEQGGLRHADPERRLLFLGDLVDRGPESIDLVNLVRRAVADGVALCFEGNHERKLVNFVDHAQAGTIDRWSSWANAESGCALLRMPEDKRRPIVEFLRQLPDCAVFDDGSAGLPPIAFVHGNIIDFHPDLSLGGDLVHGQSGPYNPGVTTVDTDAMYHDGFQLGVNRHLVIRGHIPPTGAGQQPSILSLENHGYQRGELLLLRLDGFVRDLKEGVQNGSRIGLDACSQEAFARNVLRQRCEYDFDAKSAKRFALGKGMERLVADKLARRYTDDSGLLIGYKYSKEVFFNGSWDASEWLIKARGLVLDHSGAIVSHPFDKVFNAGEQGAGSDLQDDHKVLSITKLNGFLGIISPHPFRRGELLVHTQGSLDSKGEFTQYVRDLLDPRTAGVTAAFLARNPMTLMFEVLHPKDPHIIPYGQDMMGLHLIGARGLGFDDKEKTEEEVDAIAAQLGLRRPAWKRCTWGEARAETATCQHEGFMLREDSPDQPFILKAKSPYYLTAKFLGRLSDGNAKFLFANPQQFKKHVDEELYPVVDAVTQRFAFDEFIALAHEERVPIMREMIGDIDFTRVEFTGRSKQPRPGK